MPFFEDAVRRARKARKFLAENGYTIHNVRVHDVSGIVTWIGDTGVRDAGIGNNYGFDGSKRTGGMDEHKRREMDKMDDMFGMQYSISVENQPYPVLCTLSADGCTTQVPDFPKVTAQAPTLDAALLEVKQQIQKALRQYKNPPIPTKQDQIVVPQNSMLVLVKAS